MAKRGSALWRKRISLTKKKLYGSGKLKAWNKNKKMDAEARLHMSLGQKKYLSGDKLRVLRLSKIARMAFVKNPKLRQRLVEFNQTYWTKSRRNERSRDVKKYYREHPEFLKAHIERLKSMWKDKEFRAEQKARSAIFYMLHPENLEILEEASKKAGKRHLKTLSGYIVRSKGEKLISDFLFSHGIKFEYEKHHIFLRFVVSNPDFYLPEHKILIEFYGGYPFAWVKKVIKGADYSALKIPVIAITPAELKNLNYYLLDEISKLKKTAKKFNIKKFEKLSKKDMLEFAKRKEEFEKLDWYRKLKRLR